MKTIDNFKNAYFFLSNFCPVKVTFEGREYPSTEHAYQAAKTLDQVERANISYQPDSAGAKRAGRHIRELRSDWEDVKLDVMQRLLYEKFAYNNSFRKRLIATFPGKLIESNWWGDIFWGVFNGVGENHLGRLLMSLREQLLWDDLKQIGLEEEAIILFLDQLGREEICKTI